MLTLLQEAQQHAISVSDRRAQLLAFTAIAEIEDKFADLDPAKSILPRLIGELANFADVKVKAGILERLSKLNRISSNLQQAVDIANMAEDEITRVELLCDAAAAQTVASNRRLSIALLQAALSSANSIVPQGHADDAALVVIGTAIELGELEIASNAAYGLSGNREKVSALRDTVFGPELSVRHIKEPLGLVKAGRIDESIAALRHAVVAASQLPAQPLHDNLLHDLAKDQLAIQDWQGLIDTVHEITDPDRTSDLMRGYIRAFVRTNRDEMVRNILLHLNSKPKALGFLLDLAAEQLDAGTVAEASKTLHHASRMAALLPDPGNQIVAYQALARALCQAGDAERAAFTADLIEEPVQRAAALIMIARCRHDAGYSEDASLVASQVLDILGADDGEEQDEFDQEGQRKQVDDVLTATAALFSSVGDVDGILQAISLIEDEVVKVGNLLYAAKVRLNRGEIDNASRILTWPAVPGAITAAFQRNDIDQFTFSQDVWEWLADIARSQARLGDFDGAFRTFNLLRGRKEEALGLIAGGQAKRHDLNAAEATLFRIKNPFYRLLGIYESLGEAAGFADRFVLARLLREGVLAATKYTEVTPPDTLATSPIPGAAFKTLALDLASVGDITSAVEAANRLPDYMGPRETLIEIAKFQASAGDTTGAVQLLLRLLGQIGHSNLAAYGSIAATQAWVGDEGGAMRWISSLKDPLAKTYALIGVLEGMIKRQEGAILRPQHRIARWEGGLESLPDILNFDRYGARQ